ncbi:MAG: hypothetical protein HXY52_04885 [Nitrospirae bacterium]|jgi:hypothetical protein|nr:hypothetical protein [Nitrospirota bacterium]
MNKLNKILFYLFIIGLISACAPTSKTTQGDLDANKEEVYTFSIPANSISRELKDITPEILKGFPFVSFQPVSNFKGKYPPEFYTRIKHEWTAETLKSADIWKLRNDKNIYDFLYTTPLWIGDLQLTQNDLLKNIVYSSNISEEQFNVLENWIKQGGILWIESAIFISSYDYNLNNFNEKKIKDITDRLSVMTIFGNKVHVRTSYAKRIDEFNTEKLSMVISPEQNIIKRIMLLDRQIDKLLLEQTDYVGIYITLDGEPLIKSGDSVYASYINYGKGKIITIVPFDFKNVHYDGELLRLNLILWALNDRK